MVYSFKRLLFISVLLLCFCKLKAQFNDSTRYYVNFASSGSINKAEDKSAYLLNNGLKFKVRMKRLESNLTSSWVYGRQDRELSNNDFSAGLDFNFQAKLPKLYYWGQANYNTSHSLNINNQLLTGAGLTYRLFDDPEKKLSLSDGVLFDASDIILGDQTQESYSTFRNSFRLNFMFIIKKIIKVESSSFLQNSLNYSNDYNIKTNNSISLKLTQWLSFDTNYSYNKIARTERENHLLSYGLKMERYF
ncbi:DUF481 domain-containing protein [Pseudopedobacter beijingensis]|uniref:DUF481 domain-containing protein n=1 Tax=Pseudopedobacter beijingensis TaxID=1207056 RepID=A0ABW4IAT6_9SPHI